MVASTGSGLTVVQDDLDSAVRAIKSLADTRVMVGIPSERAGRQDAEGENINNAALGYIHENGAPEVNIPARPWLVPGVKSVQKQTEEGLMRAAKAATERGLYQSANSAAEKSLNAVGLRAVSAVRAYLTAGVTPPLQDDTIRNRRYGRGTQSMRPGEKAELKRRAAGEAPGVSLVKPLINSAQMMNAVTYVLRKAGRGPA